MEPQKVVTDTVIGKKDHILMSLIGAFAVIFLLAFSVLLIKSGLIDYRMTDTSYLGDDVTDRILGYRERRATLMLVLRAYTVSFGYVIGLILCTYGGIFILRRVESKTDISIGAQNQTLDRIAPRVPALANRYPSRPIHRGSSS